MPRTMYDADRPYDIPLSAEMVAGYIDWAPGGTIAPWSQAEWDRFPHAVKVRIAKNPRTNDGHVGDCEPYLMTPAQLVDWVLLRRSAGADPTGYCSLGAPVQNGVTYGWQACKAAFARRGVPEPHWWVAAYPGGGPVVLTGSVAHQYASDASSGGHFDLSAVADFWPGVDAAPAPAPVNPIPGKDTISMIRVPKGGSKDAPVNFPLAMSMLWEHDVIIAPGDMPVVLFHAYNWDWAEPGTGGDPGYHVIGTHESFSFIVPAGTGKCDLVYWADDDFTVAVERRV